MNKVVPFLWFDANAEEAAEFYLSVFPDSRKLSELRVGEAGPGPAGALLTVHLELAGQQMTFLKAAPAYPFTPAFSFVVRCEDQAEIDRYWEALLVGGREMQCGWLTDRFGLCWQIIPVSLTTMLTHPAAMRAMMGMKKLVVAELEAAARGGERLG